MQSAERDVTPVAEGRMAVRDATRLMREILNISHDFRAHVGDNLDVNPTDLRAMEHLIASGPLGPTELARRLGVSTAAATTVVDRLAASGHVSRTRHPTDRRAIIVVPNPASVDRAMASIMPMVMGIDGALDHFDSEEQATITRYLEMVERSYRSQLPG